MKVSDFGIKEVWNTKATFLAFLGMRLVQSVSVYSNGIKILIVGVPPWRTLRADDLYKKRCYEVK